MIKANPDGNQETQSHGTRTVSRVALRKYRGITRFFLYFNYSLNALNAHYIFPMKEINELFLNSKEVSKCLSISIRTLQKLSKEGKIKAIKIGKLWKYNKSDIEKYLFFGTDFSREPVKIKDNFVEYRNHSRINTNFECYYLINLSPFKHIDNEGIIKNISAGGVLLITQNETMDKIELGDPIDLDFNLKKKTEIINIKTEGRIIRKNTNGIGIKFRDIDEETRNKIIQYVG